MRRRVLALKFIIKDSSVGRRLRLAGVITGLKAERVRD
jgi:hypothetical protein